MSNNKVRDWMTPKPITISTNSPLQDAYWLMLDRRIRRLPVMDGEKLVGIVTLDNLRSAESLPGIGLDLVRISEMLSRICIRQVMTSEPETIAPDEPLIDAAQLMLKNKVSALPVMEENQLVGIITESDIFRAFVELEEKK